MAMAAVKEFDTWLYDRLRDLQTDENIFGPYIKSIVEGDEDTEEKIEALDGLLIELSANLHVAQLRDEILERWDKANSAISSKSSLSNSNSLSAGFSLTQGKGTEGNSGSLLEANPSSGQLKSDCNGEVSESLGNQMDAFLRLSGLDSQSNTSSDNRATSSSSSSRRPQSDLGADSALRAAILSQYCANESSSEDENDGPAKAKQKGGQLDGLDKNDNAEKVLSEQRELKEKSRAEHAKKKDRDKDDRAKQKQAAQDRKDKAKKKATKGERKR